VVWEGEAARPISIPIFQSDRRTGPGAARAASGHSCYGPRRPFAARRARHAVGASGRRFLTLSTTLGCSQPARRLRAEGIHGGVCDYSRKATVMSNSLSPRELTVEAEPSPDDIRYLEDSIYAFNVRATGIADGELFGIFLRDDARVVVGGAFGWTWARSCKVRILFVPIHLRNQGHGTKLMRAVEAEAKAHGCRQILLETYDFQAPQFYPRSVSK
jgi:GNAT superfamily N-acetyltransferase